MPLLALEVISEKYNGEYEDKFTDYQTLGILYYAIYNPFSGRRGRFKKRQRLEVYRLIAGKYELLQSENNRVWLPEIGLALGYEQGEHIAWVREWLYWYDEAGDRYLTAQERANQERLIATQERLIAQQERLAKQEAEAIADQQKLIAEQERLAKEEAEAIAQSERLAKQEAEAIAQSERLAKQEAEAIAQSERLIAERERLAKQEAEQKAQRLAERLRMLGINPDEM
jgi:Putative restriction endonuclease